MLNRRRGHSAVEMLVALGMTGILLVAVGAMGFRQQRFHRDVVIATERIEQLDHAASLVPVALRDVAPGEGDIPAGGAMDTAFEFRATIATGVACDSGGTSLVLAPIRPDAPILTSILERPESG